MGKGFVRGWSTAAMTPNPTLKRDCAKARSPLASRYASPLTLTLALIYTVPMPTPIATAEYMKLSVSERIQLVEDIWDSIAADAPNTVDLSQAQKAELHRRVAA